ncbi:hypothetical protein K0M31_010185, partial [Melipona bicolor]
PPCRPPQIQKTWKDTHLTQRTNPLVNRLLGLHGGGWRMIRRRWLSVVRGAGGQQSFVLVFRRLSVASRPSGVGVLVDGVPLVVQKALLGRLGGVRNAFDTNVGSWTNESVSLHGDLSAQGLLSGS